MYVWLEDEAQKALSGYAVKLKAMQLYTHYADYGGEEKGYFLANKRWKCEEADKSAQHDMNRIICWSCDWC